MRYSSLKPIQKTPTHGKLLRGVQPKGVVGTCWLVHTCPGNQGATLWNTYGCCPSPGKYRCCSVVNFIQTHLVVGAQ